MKKNFLKLTSKILILSSSVLFVFCGGPQQVEKVTMLNKVTINAEDTLPSPIKKEGDAHGGKYYWKIDSANVYGINYAYNIPDSVHNKNLRVKLDSWVRMTDLSHDQKYALSLEDGNGKVLKWSEVNFRNFVTEINKWVHVVDSIVVPGNFINTPGLIIKTYSYNPDAKATLDCDDVELTFSSIEVVNAE